MATTPPKTNSVNSHSTFPKYPPLFLVNTRLFLTDYYQQNIYLSMTSFMEGVSRKCNNVVCIFVYKYSQALKLYLHEGGKHIFCTFIHIYYKRPSLNSLSHRQLNLQQGDVGKGCGFYVFFILCFPRELDSLLDLSHRLLAVMLKKRIVF